MHERSVGLGIGPAVLGDRLHRLLEAAVEADHPAVPEEAGRERVHRQVVQPRPRQVQLGRDAGHVDDVVGGGVGVEEVAGDRLVGTRATTRLIGGLEHDDAPAGLGQVAGRNEAVVTTADDDDGCLRHRSPPLTSTEPASPRLSHVCQAIAGRHMVAGCAAERVR